MRCFFIVESLDVEYDENSQKGIAADSNYIS